MLWKVVLTFECVDEILKFVFPRQGLRSWKFNASIIVEGSPNKRAPPPPPPEKINNRPTDEISWFLRRSPMLTSRPLLRHQPHFDSQFLGSETVNIQQACLCYIKIK